MPWIPPEGRAWYENPEVVRPGRQFHDWICAQSVHMGKGLFTQTNAGAAQTMACYLVADRMPAKTSDDVKFAW